MLDRLAFTVAGAPRGKARARSVPRLIWQNGQPKAVVTVYGDPATERAEAEVLRIFRLKWPDHVPWAGAVQLRFTAVFEPPASWTKALKEAAASGLLYHTSKPDKDNIEKLIVDALNGWAWADDAQVMGGGVKRYGSVARLDIILEPLASPGLPITPAVKAAQARIAAGEVRPAVRGARAKAPKSNTRSPLQRAIDSAIAKGR